VRCECGAVCDCDLQRCRGKFVGDSPSGQGGIVIGHVQSRLCGTSARQGIKMFGEAT
jgi:hypothetical protein